MTTPIRAALLALALLAAPALAQDPEELRIALPDVPQLGPAASGVQVVKGIDLEVFFAAGAYWVRQDQGWFSTRLAEEPFVLTDPRRVPAALLAHRPDPALPAVAAPARAPEPPPAARVEPPPAAQAPAAAPAPAARAEAKAAPAKPAVKKAPAKPARKPAGKLPAKPAKKPGT
ncbi:MAG: hypothetical protein IPO09_01285 [Anaeromyxobacter sp.]|nr:hypothetical protein [Anaeromyxobacter sp.]MBL0278206.1 hypothetical protein [Anaeromyxobacter sp.]